MNHDLLTPLNAIKYPPNGGTVTLSTKACDKGHIFEITDTGIGISEDHICDIIEPFHRVNDIPTQNNIEGTGLGLAIVKSLIDLHDGELDIASTLGEGTTVKIMIPFKTP